MTTNSKTSKRRKCQKSGETLDDLLEQVVMIDPFCWENDDGPGGWAVADESGIIAYFGTESRACSFRLNEIDRRLNAS